VILKPDLKTIRDGEVLFFKRNTLVPIIQFQKERVIEMFYIAPVSIITVAAL